MTKVTPELYKRARLLLSTELTIRDISTICELSQPTLYTIKRSTSYEDYRAIVLAQTTQLKEKYGTPKVKEPVNEWGELLQGLDRIEKKVDELLTKKNRWTL